MDAQRPTDIFDTRDSGGLGYYLLGVVKAIIAVALVFAGLPALMAGVIGVLVYAVVALPLGWFVLTARAGQLAAVDDVGITVHESTGDVAVIPAKDVVLLGVLHRSPSVAAVCVTFCRARLGGRPCWVLFVADVKVLRSALECRTQYNAVGL